MKEVVAKSFMIAGVMLIVLGLVLGLTTDFNWGYPFILGLFIGLLGGVIHVN